MDGMCRMYRMGSTPAISGGETRPQIPGLALEPWEVPDPRPEVKSGGRCWGQQNGAKGPCCSWLPLYSVLLTAMGGGVIGPRLTPLHCSRPPSSCSHHFLFLCSGCVRGFGCEIQTT
jgi:hypothetical protein